MRKAICIISWVTMAISILLACLFLLVQLYFYNDVLNIVNTVTYFIAAVCELIIGILALTKISDKTFGICAVIFGVFSSVIILVLSIIFLTSNTDNSKNSQPLTQTSTFLLTETDREIASIRKQLELIELKKEAERINAQKQIELARLKEHLNATELSYLKEQTEKINKGSK